MDGKGTVATWKDKHRRMYDQATRHPFIMSIRDGAVDYSAFKRWLGQDYIFVRQFIPFTASVIIKSCKHSDEESDMQVLLSGISSLNDEISWFKTQAQNWDVHLHSLVPLQANLNYCKYLESLMEPEVDYSVAITAFWAIEAVYQESFAQCLESSAKTPNELIETCQRWGNAGFGDYCVSLQRIADRCLKNASSDVLSKAEETFISVLQHEVNFWNMSSG
ncbi:probable bifunctional TENA-E protein [Dioscorea cayenensis subsp. rotundata]|uniref:aminopyrimidine aminohydrolase n=1 Tax=Dioscorea cayennensis subsp. rotundata TaxID=55577 RepID=A0AB40BLK8_DIOCR|nr:probable bifunctional TENA-E protein [Dioscorea cayenensis subsp. rotundata]